MTTLEIARVFGVNVKGLCGIMGYSKAGLDLIQKGKVGKRSHRLPEAVAKLRRYTEDAYLRERREAEQRLWQRMAMCDRLANKKFGESIDAD